MNEYEKRNYDAAILFSDTLKPFVDSVEVLKNSDSCSDFQVFITVAGARYQASKDYKGFINITKAFQAMRPRTYQKRSFCQTISKYRQPKRYKKNAKSLMRTRKRSKNCKTRIYAVMQSTCKPLNNSKSFLGLP